MLIELVKWLGLALVFMLGPVLLIHELGHFLAAKWAGVRVIEFGVGFPPRLLTVAQERGVLKVGDVQMALPPRLKIPKNLEPGETVEVAALPEEDGSYRAVSIKRTEEPPYQERTSKELRVRGELETLEEGTRYSLNLLPIGAFVRMLGEEDPSHPRSLAAQPKRWRLVVLLAGIFLNLVAALLIMAAAFMSGVPDNYFVQIEGVMPDTPAEATGLQAGDVLVSVDGEKLEEGPGELREWILASPGEALTLGVMRDGERITLTATPETREGSGFLGIMMRAWPDANSLTHYSPPRALFAAGKEFIDTFARIFSLPRMVAEGEVEPSDLRPTALPGILQWLGLSLKQSIEWKIAFPALHFTAMISLAIALTNLLPLPALDGGRVVFVLIEAVRGKRVSPTIEATVHMVGLAILLLLSIFIIIQDIIHPILPWSMLSR